MPNFRDQLNAIVAIEKSFRFSLYKELLEQYKNQMIDDPEVLAVQASNYLMGDDFAKVYNSLSPDMQTRIDKIKDLIEVKGDEAMTKNKKVRELIIRYVMTTSLIYHCISHLLEKGWFDKPEIKNREKLIRKYSNDADSANEFPEVEDFDKFMAVAVGFIKSKQ